LFFYFGLKLLKDSWEMSSDGPSEELQEVEEELVDKKTESGGADDEEGDVESQAKGRKPGSAPAWLCSMGAENFKVFSQVILYILHAQRESANYLYLYIIYRHSH
jgi:hypothetical protein